MEKLTNRILGLFLLIFLLGFAGEFLWLDLPDVVATIGAVGSSLFILIRLLLLPEKKLTDYFKYFGISLYIFSILFKWNNWPYGGELAIGGLVLVVIWFILNNFQSTEMRSTIWGNEKSPILKISVAIFMLGTMFKIMHWKGATMILWGAFLGLSFWITKKFVIEGK